MTITPQIRKKAISWIINIALVLVAITSVAVLVNRKSARPGSSAKSESRQGQQPTSDDLVIAPHYALKKELKEGEEPYTGPKVLYAGTMSKKTGHIVLEIVFKGEVQRFAWQPAPAGQWIQGEWTVAPAKRVPGLYGNGTAGSFGESGIIQIFEEPGGQFRIVAHEPDPMNRTRYIHMYNGVLSPVWNAS